VYRLKKLTPGKAYTCRNCGGPLVRPDAIVSGDAGSAPLAAPDRDNAADVARGRLSIAAGRAPESDLSRLPRMIEQLAERLDALKGLERADGGDDPAARLLEMSGRLEQDLREFSGTVERRLAELDEKMTAVPGGEVVRRLEELETRLSGLAENAAASSSGLHELKSALDEHRDARKQELDAQLKEMRSLLAPPENAPDPTVEVDIDELADRLVAGVRGRGNFLDPDAESAVDAMARLADELVREQSANSSRLDKLAEEIRSATSGISKLEEWRGELPERVADEIGQTVEARVVGPISDTLTRQAPAILSEWHDNKLVDLVSRSVREAQRPLLREILAGGRRGVPLWLFASVLLPLLLILGYLFLPGDFAGRESGAGARDEEAAESLARIESGMNVVADNEDRLRNIEDAVLDIHSEALAHVKNATALEEEVKNLKAAIAERDALLNEYKDTLQKQVKRLQGYEMRLVQLGVSPKSISE
jgi:DNA repair exonuclease SbcCD ATPase subunit